MTFAQALISPTGPAMYRQRTHKHVWSGDGGGHIIEMQPRRSAAVIIFPTRVGRGPLSTRHHPPYPVYSEGGRLVGGVSLLLRLLRLHVRHTAGVAGVRCGDVGGRVVGRRCVGRGVRGLVVIGQRRLNVGRDGHFLHSAAETAQGEVGQDPLNEWKKRKFQQQRHSGGGRGGGGGVLPVYFFYSVQQGSASTEFSSEFHMMPI